MYTRILVPLDGSRRAERAIPVAARIARASGGAVILVRAVNVASGFWPSLVGEATIVQSALDAGQAAAEEYLAAIKQAPALAGIPTETRIVSGPVGEAILAVAESSQADLMVLCSHGYTGMTRWALGSVAEKVARYALVPVLVLREAGPVRRQDLARIYGADVIADFSQEDVVQRILDLTDEQGVDTAIEALGADVTFQHAIKVTKAGGTISNVGYHGHGDFVHIPRIEWGVGMAEKTITTGLCPGGRLRMERLLRVLEMKRVDPTLMTTHTFPFDQMARAFEIMDKKLDGVLKPLIVF